ARLYTDSQREASRTRALLEIANLLNSRSDFGELTSHVLERANELVGADYCALGVVEPAGQSISLAAFKAAPHATTLRVRELIEGIAVQIGTALERDQLSAEVMRLRSALHERHAEDRIIGQSPAILRARELALNVADTQTSVLIQGESGTGKELLANLIHYNSRQKEGPYVKLNCGEIPEALLEFELFGHESGAFTDERQRRRGRVEEADGGTPFLG